MPDGAQDIIGIDKLAPEVPDELLPNLGRGSGWNTLLDMVYVAKI
jgi:hypothetical protein